MQDLVGTAVEHFFQLKLRSFLCVVAFGGDVVSDDK